MVRSIAVVAVVALVSLPSGRAEAQGSWQVYASGFGGGSAIPAFDIDLRDPALAATLDLQGRKVVAAAAVGGSVGVWNKRPGRRSVWGVRADVLYQRANADPQVLTARGTLGGRSFAGALPVPEAKGSVSFLTGAVLLGWQLGDSSKAVGRVTPYLGVGGGIDRATIEASSLEDEDWGSVVQALAGVSVALGERVSAFGEYRFGRVRQTILLGTQHNEFAAKPNHFVAGFTIGF
jgi:opacity protein-like surface antigen